jgi:hypothetical protein
MEVRVQTEVGVHRVADLLESDWKVKVYGFLGVTGDGQGVLLTEGRGTRDQLHLVQAGVVFHLQTQSHTYTCILIYSNVVLFMA